MQHFLFKVNSRHPASEIEFIVGDIHRITRTRSGISRKEHRRDNCDFSVHFLRTLVERERDKERRTHASSSCVNLTKFRSTKWR